MTDDLTNLLDDAPTWRLNLPHRPLTGLTVLVVEDSRYASEAVRLLCLRSGARIRRADTIRAALRHLQTYRPGVIIVDMGLPDGDGADMIRTIARGLPRVPVILGISGDEGNRDAAMRAGADGFIAKPIESLAQFQQTILASLPGQARPTGPRLVADEMIVPDHATLRDDLAHVVEVLSVADDETAIDYIARFLAGVARSAHDRPLEDAATALARDHARGQALAGELARVSGMVQDRLASVQGL
ncbi:response regulator [Paracoccus sp. CPCC 101403]|uniref:Response regulator n=1 Tax=Paracoccus broussonetiae TaxID=3075834 RepID=A0ABU3EHJ5_9RHOB|nr:response regulator [Paracoccus sp. CPCC 101403]MDT1062915.1 response regulator [Paracoccus sp. CPCC 101403]